MKASQYCSLKVIDYSLFLTSSLLKEWTMITLSSALIICVFQQERCRLFVQHRPPCGHSSYFLLKKYIHLYARCSTRWNSIQRCNPFSEEVKNPYLLRTPHNFWEPLISDFGNEEWGRLRTAFFFFLLKWANLSFFNDQMIQMCRIYQKCFLT